MKLYTKMKARVAKKRLGARLFNLARSGQVVVPEVGKLYNDCDGFNHRLIETEWIESCYSRGRVINDAIFTREDGLYFCGCLYSLLEPPHTKEEIVLSTREFYLLSIEEIEEECKQGWWKAEQDAKRQFILDGGVVCTDEGMPSKEWQNLSCG